MAWKVEPLPIAIAQQLSARGAVPGSMYLFEEGPRRLAVIESFDPIGGVSQRHASISASTRGLKRVPSQCEIVEAAKAIGFDGYEVLQSTGSDIVHLWPASK